MKPFDASRFDLGSEPVYDQTFPGVECNVPRCRWQMMRLGLTLADAVNAAEQHWADAHVEETG